MCACVWGGGGCVYVCVRARVCLGCEDHCVFERGYWEVFMMIILRGMSIKLWALCPVGVAVTQDKSNNSRSKRPGVISLRGRTYQTETAMWGDMFYYSATITLVPQVTLVLHGLLPLHPLYNIHVLLHNI